MEGEIVKGAWECRKCNFVLYKRILSVEEGEVYVDTRLQREECPNGCGLLVQCVQPSGAGSGDTCDKCKGPLGDNAQRDGTGQHCATCTEGILMYMEEFRKRAEAQPPCSPGTCYCGAEPNGCGGTTGSDRR